MRFLFLSMILSLVGCQSLSRAFHKDKYAVGDCFNVKVEDVITRGKIIDKGEDYYVLKLDIPDAGPATLLASKAEFEDLEVVTKVDCN